MKLFGKMLWTGALSAMVALSASALADTKPTLKIGYVEGWDDSVATSNVA
ncbi:glycine/betaine ABC transporter substrate-binding protein, partial [Pseudomonas sp. MWU13-2625]